MLRVTYTDLSWMSGNVTTCLATEDAVQWLRINQGRGMYPTLIVLGSEPLLTEEDGDDLDAAFPEQAFIPR